jgi:hypothetical protein
MLNYYLSQKLKQININKLNHLLNTLSINSKFDERECSKFHQNGNKSWAPDKLHN